MPPSPAFRFSPRELNHKRGRSLESGLHLKQKDDDLALFSDMQSREKDSFLLHSSENIEDSFSTQLKYFSDYKLGITIPVRGESSDLLDGDGDKNDYDWLLTPPDTPLFPSLDDEPPLVNPVHRGRPRSQPIAISRTAMAEKCQRSNRSSASPQRLSPHHLSPSPRSGGSSFQTRGRASSAPNGSPNLLLRPTTPTRRPSTPPNKPSTPAPRSSTPTLRRMSTGSSGTLSSTKRSGTSPGKTSRGNSASPKLRAWQTTLPGFSSDPPPNLRTSLSDRPASHVRGASPASRSGRGRQSMSPTASRSGSSRTHDRDRYSTQSRGSIASSGDDEIDSLQSLPVGTIERPTMRKSNSFSSKTVSSVKKHSKTFSASSAPKRSFDYTLRQMDQRKSPQNMFRPLLSSVPSTTFYVGKSNSTYRSMISRNSSVTTSSNASSELGASIAPDTEGSDHEQDELTSEWGKAPQVDGQEEIFVFDKLDEVNEEVKGEEGQQSLDNCGKNTCTSSQHEPLIYENFSSSHPVEIAGTTSESSHVRGDPSHVNHGEVVYCSICGSKFYLAGSVEGDIHVCLNCSEKDSLPAFKGQDTNIHEKALEASEDVGVIELPESSCNSLIDQSTRNVEQVSGLKTNTLEEFEQYVVGRQVEALDKVETNIPNSNMVNHQLRHLTSLPTLKIDGSEGAGISLLLKRSVSSKWPVVQGRAFTASNIPCDDPSYVRDSLSSVRSFNGPGTSSASTSVDWSSHRQSDIRFQRQLSNKKVDMESSREDLNTILLCTRSSSSGALDNANDAPVKARNMSDDHLVDSAVDLANGALEEERLARRADSGAMESVGMDDIDLPFVGKPMLEEDKFDLSDNGRLITSTSDLSTTAQSIQFVETSRADIVNCVDYCTMEDAEGDFSTIAKGVSDMGFAVPEVGAFVIDKDSSPTANVHEVEVSGASTPDCMSTVAVEKEESLTSTTSSQNEDLGSPESKRMAEEAQKPSDSAVIDKDATVSASEAYIADNGQGISEESTVTVEGSKGHKTRSLTLEEATDTILFCRSIIQDLAYEAATIAMEREDPVPVQALEGSRPTVTILGAHSPKREPRSRTSKRTPKGQKHRHRRLDSNSKNPSTKDENEKMGENLPDNSAAPTRLDSAKPPKLESKCNCTVM
ncbi:hypothetical protein H6P81_012780 [Aristolochia fimbriata]|uniref:Uncharacterized protein n=1 Tax=Aristolochia fimbriata TaxID=158543 RepID=A0AAV7EGE5_ARIFI|nr:hypothetical protein H6P81_012780 [Aristolochia fimbriata]